MQGRQGFYFHANLEVEKHYIFVNGQSISLVYLIPLSPSPFAPLIFVNFGSFFETLAGMITYVICALLLEKHHIIYFFAPN